MNKMEPFYPLHVWVCDQCFLVQLPEAENADEIFGTDYAYFSSYSDSWLKHAKDYVHQMIDNFGINSKSHVVEIASNDGYLLQYFKEREIPVLGIEPSGNVAEAAEAIGIPTLVKFFGVETAEELLKNGTKADLVVGNNVLAHVPDINDFVEGLRILLNAEGLITMEFPHLMQLVENNQFDTIYHEHFSYFSLVAVQTIFAKHSLTIVDVEELPTHGGSLRIYARHTSEVNGDIGERVDNLYKREVDKGYTELRSYDTFSERVYATKRNLLEFLLDAKNKGKSIVGYGAPAKGNTLLNYCGIRTDFLDYTVDRSPHKANKLLPGTHIPIYSPEKIRETKPDYVLILPWNIKDEIMDQIGYIRDWNGQFVIPIPDVEIL
jgi:SAM-dependent methyltransferase